MVSNRYSNTGASGSQAPGPSEIRQIFDVLDGPLQDLLRRLQQYRWTGRKGYPLEALMRAYLCSFLLNLDSTNDLIRRLEDDRELRLLCGLPKLPHRSTFNRFIKRLDDHHDLVEECLQNLTSQLRGELPDLGAEVAIDSTTVRTHSNPNRPYNSDPEATWTARNKSSSKDRNLVWNYGYKYHLMADARYGIPITGMTTTASINDSPRLPELLDQAQSQFSWFKPKFVSADRGYDSLANHKAVMKRGAAPIIAIRQLDGGPTDSVLTNYGEPICLGRLVMDYVRSDPRKGHLYKCPPSGCHLKARQGVLYCHETMWVTPKMNPRLVGPIRRASQEWKTLYRKRYTVERVFKSLKQSRRLEKHHIRGLKRITLHCTMAVLAFQATALMKILNARYDYRWMVRRVA